MTLTAAQKQLGTLPARHGRRYLAPGSLPTRVSANGPLRDLLNEYLAQVEEYRKDDSTVTRLTQQIEQAREQRTQIVYEARVKGKPEPKDPVPGLEKKLEAAQAALDLSEYTMCQTSDRIQDMRDDPDLAAYADESFTRHLERIIDMATTLDWEMDDLGDALYLKTWVKSHKPSKKVLGRSEVAALRRQLAKYQDTEPPRRVSPAAMAALQRGEDVQDIDGNPLPFAVAEDLHKRGKLRVNHGQLLPRNAPEQE